MALLALLAILISIIPVMIAGIWLWKGLDGDAANALGDLVLARLPALTIVVLLSVAAIGGLVAWLYDSYGLAAARLADEVEIMVEACSSQRLREEGPREIKALALAVNRLANARAASLDEVGAQVRAARAESEREKNMLAALVDDLAQAVVVCNADGRILLYNARAYDMFTGTGDGTGGFIGLGRRLAEVMEPGLVDHILDRLTDLVEQGRQTTLSFVTSTSGGRLVRARVRPASPELKNGGERFIGFVVLAEDITRAAEASARQERGLQALTEKMRAGVGRILVIADRLLAEPVQTERFPQELAHIQWESRDLAQLVMAAQRDKGEILRASQPMEEMRTVDLLQAVQRRIEARIGLPSQLEELGPPAWIRVDSFTFMQALSFLTTRVAEACDVREVKLRAQTQHDEVLLSIVWAGTALSGESAAGWELEPMTLAGESTPLSVREVIERHGARLNYERDRARIVSYFHIRIPRVEPQEHTEARPTAGSTGRLEFYDFDLFGQGRSSDQLEDIELADLTFTVFDTETTGPDPSGGDEIIQIGALRIVNGRLLRGERFEQYVDPQRPINPESLKIHGITRDRLRGQPLIGDVLPRFHAFCADTVLVAHNAAFDMRFLQLKEAATGLKFEQPVLDTLLLSVVLHPNQDSHRLEAMAERFGVGVVDRHDAFADALITGQLFLRMIPLLAERGIRTLGQARAASQETYHARITY